MVTAGRKLGGCALVEVGEVGETRTVLSIRNSSA
jgi:hypothetical protein